MTANQLVHMIDDDEAVRRSTGFLLKTLGYSVKGHESGDAFLKIARHDPGCILLDLRMHGMDGLEVQEDLRARGVALPGLMLSGTDDVSRSEARRVGNEGVSYV